MKPAVMAQTTDMTQQCNRVSKGDYSDDMRFAASLVGHLAITVVEEAEAQQQWNTAVANWAIEVSDALGIRPPTDEISEEFLSILFGARQNEQRQSSGDAGTHGRDGIDHDDRGYPRTGDGE